MNNSYASIVTGGGRGIGRAIALRLAGANTAVLVVGRRKSELESVCAEIVAAGGQADFLVGDVSKRRTATSAVARIKRHGWILRNLVCNAGIAKGGPCQELDPEIFEEMFAVNVFGTNNFIRACLPSMIAQQGGSITIVSSILGLRPAKYESGYAATKAALVRMAECIGLETAKHNITVVPLCPGFVATDMTERTIAGLQRHRNFTREEAERKLASVNPQGRILLPEEIAEAAAFVASSPGSRFSARAMDLTGSTEPRVLKLVNWIYTNAAAAHELVVPVSGGSDSALAFALCAMAHPDKTLGVFLGPPEKLRCRQWFEGIGKVMFVDDVQPIGKDAEIARWMRLLQLSNSRNAWLVGSRNHTEELTGFYSLVSRVATFLPLSGIWKSEVMELCRLIGVPEAVTASSRRADPDCGRPPELAEIPLEMIDTFLRVQEGQLPQAALFSMTAVQVDYLRGLISKNRFKRFLPTKGPSLRFPD